MAIDKTYEQQETKEVRLYGIPVGVLDSIDQICEQIGMSRNALITQLLTEIAGFSAPHVALIPTNEGELVVNGRAGNHWGLRVLRVRYSKGWGYLSRDDMENLTLARQMVLNGETLSSVKAFLEGRGYVTYLQSAFELEEG